MRSRVLGDFEEMFESALTSEGPRVARRQYVREVLRSAPSLIFDRVYWSWVLAANHLRVSARHLYRQKLYSTVNVLGLAVGMASCLLILHYVRYEHAFDRSLPDAERIYRVAMERRGTAQEFRSAETPRPLAAVLTAAVPGVEAATRLSRERTEQVLVRTEDRAFFESGFVFADSNYFDVFDTGLLSGNPTSALSEPYSVLVTPATARKYFGAADPIGQTLEVRLRGDGTVFTYTVTGIARALPDQSHFHFDFLASYRQHPFATDDDGRERGDWAGRDVYTYVKLTSQSTPDGVSSSFPDLVESYVKPFLAARANDGDGQSDTGEYRYFLQRVTDIHLRSDLQDEFEPSGGRLTVSALSYVALFILAIACINFVNLSTARAARRAREVGMRKVLGSHRRQLAAQYLLESVLLSIAAFLLSLALARMALPLFSNLSGRSITSVVSGGPRDALFLFLVAICVGLASGAYPAFLLSSFRPIGVLGGSSPGAGRSRRRTHAALVWFQFAIATLIIVASVVVALQMRYVRHAELGFDRDQVAVIGETHVLRDQIEPFREAVEDIPGIVRAATGEAVPGRALGESRFVLESDSSHSSALLSRMYAGFGFLETLGVDLVSGRLPSARFGTDSTAAVLNTAAVQALGVPDPVGLRLVRQGNGLEYTVVGVVEDFHFDSMHRQIAPLVVFGPDPYYSNRPRQLVAFRLAEGSPREALARIAAVWDRFEARQPLRLTFLDNEVDDLYRSELRAEHLLTAFCALAIFVACIGLFGLATYTAEQREREIGVRKALGASVLDVLILLVTDLARPVLLAFLIAAPLSYVLTRTWLNDFAYRTGAAWQSLIFTAALLAVAIVVSVGVRSLRSARTSPVESLAAE